MGLLTSGYPSLQGLRAFSTPERALLLALCFRILLAFRLRALKAFLRLHLAADPAMPTAAAFPKAFSIGMAAATGIAPPP